MEPTACVAHAKSALRYLRAHAARLGLDPPHIAEGAGTAYRATLATTDTLLISLGWLSAPR